jgi:flavodoxin
MKILIAYFSHSGNTRGVARYIQEQVGGDLLEIQLVEPYPNDYDTVAQQAKRELNSGFKPALKPSGEDIQNYDTIFLGSPNW